MLDTALFAPRFDTLLDPLLDTLRRTTSVGVLLLAVLLPGAATASEAAEPTPLEVFRAHCDDRDPKVRRKAVGQLRGERGPDVVAALVDALADDDDRVRGVAADLLRRDDLDRSEIERLGEAVSRQRRPAVRRAIVRALGASAERATPELVAALDDRDAAVRECAARELSHGDPAAAAAPLHQTLTDTTDGVRAEAIHSLGCLLDDAAVGAAAAVLRGDRADRPRVAAAGVLQAHPAPEGTEHLLVVLRDRSWTVRMACAAALGRQVSPLSSARAAARALVRSIQDESRVRVREEMATSLFLLTGIDFGPAPDRWKAWHAEAGDTFRPPDRPPRRAELVPGGTRADLLDLPTASDHVTFVLDGSHSMNDAIRFGVDTRKRDLLVAAFERALARMPEPSWVNLIPFGTEPDAYKSALVRATPQARRAAVRFLDKRLPDGRTNIYDSLVLAFADPGVDTIVLVTDGAPSEGARTTRTGILEGLADLNRFRLVRVHTVEIGAANTSKRWRGFLRQIADATGGHYLAR